MRTTHRLDWAALDGTFMTEEAYLALPETTARVELVDNVVVWERSATFDHQRVVAQLAVALDTWCETRWPKPTLIASPLDVRFGSARILQPDVLVYLDPLVRPVTMPVSRIPDLCVEIVSTRVAWDRTTKRLLYASAGVREMWTILRDPPLVERWTGPGLEVREELRDVVFSSLLPGFQLEVRHLLDL